MANQEHLDVLKQGVNVWNEWRKQHPDIKPDLIEADLSGANLIGAHLEEANLEYAHLEGADLSRAHLEGARCCRAFFDAATRLTSVTLSDEKYGSASLADVSWGEVNLSVIKWQEVKKLGDEENAVQRKLFINYQSAARANRQVTTALRDQGLNPQADHFARRAQEFDREVLKWDILLRLFRIPEHKWLGQLLRVLNRNRKKAIVLQFVIFTGGLVFLSLVLLLVNQIPFLLEGVSAVAVLFFAAFVFFQIPSIPQLLVILLLLFLLTASLFITIFYLISFLDPILQIITWFLILIALLVYLAWRQPSSQNFPDRLAYGMLNFWQYIKSLVRLFLNTLRDSLGVLFSMFLNTLAGYGYKPMRTVLWYVMVIFLFALGYKIWGNLPFFPDAFVFSMTSFHGRGFFPSLGGNATPHNPLVVVAAFEAVIGLFIEISFIATFTQRYFGR